MQFFEALSQYLQPMRAVIREAGVISAFSDPVARRVVFADLILRPMLPDRYQLSPGYAFGNGDNKRSDELMMIVDAQHSLKLGQVFACETVFGGVEVLPTLDADGLVQALQGIASLKMLKRERATLYDVTPVHRLTVFGARYAQLSDDAINPYLGYLVLERSTDAAAILSRLTELVRSGALPAELTPDGIFCLADSWAILRQTRTGFVSVPRTSFVKFGLVQPQDRLLDLMYLVLNASLARVALHSLDLTIQLERLMRDIGSTSLE